MFKRAAVSGFVLLGLTVVVPAAPFCTDTRSGFQFEFGISVGEPFTEDERNEFDLMTLRRMGVNATSVERWAGCIRAFVRLPGGGQGMEFYDPNTFERVF